MSCPDEGGMLPAKVETRASVFPPLCSGSPNISAETTGSARPTNRKRRHPGTGERPHKQTAGEDRKIMARDGSGTGWNSTERLSLRAIHGRKGSHMAAGRGSQPRPAPHSPGEPFYRGQPWFSGGGPMSGWTAADKREGALRKGNHHSWNGNSGAKIPRPALLAVARKLRRGLTFILVMPSSPSSIPSNSPDANSR